MPEMLTKSVVSKIHIASVAVQATGPSVRRRDVDEPVAARTVADIDGYMASEANHRARWVIANAKLATEAICAALNCRVTDKLRAACST